MLFVYTTLERRRGEMLKLIKRFRPLDWVFLVAIIGLTILQVFCTMKMTDYVSSLISAINYLNIQAHPEQLGTEVAALFNSLGGDWSTLYDFASNSGVVDASLLEMIASIRDASVSNIWREGGFMLLTAFGSAACSAVIAVLASAITAAFVTNLRKDINDKVSHFSLNEINKFSVASLVTRSTNDIEQITMAFLLIMRMAFAAPVTAIWAFCKINATSAELTWVTVVAVLILVLGLTTLVVVVLPKLKISQKIIDRLNLVTRENLNGVRVIRAYNAEDYQAAKFKKANDDLTKTNLFTFRAMGLLNPFMTIIMDGVTLSMYWIGATLINAGSIDYATVSAFMMLSTQIVMSFMTLLFLFVFLPRAEISAKRVNEVLETNATILDPVNPIEPTEQGTIEFKDVTFAYPDAEKPILEHISFRANQGDTIAVIGATGCGKSSLVNLIARLYDVTSGEVIVDGVNVKDQKQDNFRTKIGFVPQKGVLFSGTVASNLRLGAPSLSDEEMKKAAEIACADDFVNKMENGYDSPIAQGGTNVSGGQRQRLCIARAAAIDPEIFVFDDSFSALDFKTDLAVRSNLKKSFPKATKVIVAQRIGTIIDADLILVLENGKLVGKGKHEELLKNCDTYRSIALSQLSKEELGL